jgi:hypothetical protein
LSVADNDIISFVDGTRQTIGMLLM